jgi:hypothetical protein
MCSTPEITPTPLIGKLASLRGMLFSLRGMLIPLGGKLISLPEQQDMESNVFKASQSAAGNISDRTCIHRHISVSIRWREYRTTCERKATTGHR